MAAVCGCARQPPSYSYYNPANDYYRAIVAPAPQPTPMSEITERTKLQMTTWSDCVFDQTAKYMQANEQAEVTVRAAMTACYKQEDDLKLAISGVNGSGVSTNDLMTLRRKIVFDKLTQIVIDHRISILAARQLSNAWAECLIDAAMHGATSDRSDNEIVLATYAICRSQEDTMRRQLASFNSEAESIVENRKRRAFSILVEFVQRIKSFGTKAKRPDLAI